MIRERREESWDFLKLSLRQGSLCSVIELEKSNLRFYARSAES